MVFYLKKRETSIQIAITNKLNKLLFDHVFYTMDGIEFYNFNFKNEKFQNETQYIGKVFKDLPPVFFGFRYYDFGCRDINVINRSSEVIETLCDNRH